MDGSGRDPEVIKRIDDIRVLILSNPTKKLNFERSLTYFCQVAVRGAQRDAHGARRACSCGMV